ncbi:MAG: MFS transporter [Chloroflexi bacterium]|nr:MFS transporter [Chloroflexota bacterium]
MNRKQLAALFVCSLVTFSAGNAMMAFLPVYAVHLGTDEAGAGVYLSLSFAALSIGMLISGWLSDRFQRRKLTLILCSVVSVPAIFLMGQVGSVELLTVLTMIAWFTGGVTNATINILTALYADPRERGRIFGIMATTLALGQVLGGFASGVLVEHWGYMALFTVAAIAWIVPGLCGLLLEDRVVSVARVRKDSTVPAVAPASGAMSLWLLIGANVLASISNFSAGLARPLLMDRLGFDAPAIASAVTVSGLIILPLPFVVGWLSDRISRKQLLILSYLLASIGAVIMITALQLWQFWLSASLFALVGGMVGVGLAYVTDLVPSEGVGSALAYFSATPPLAGVIGYAGTGFILQTLGMQGTFLAGAALPVVAIGMMLLIRRQGMKVAVA